MDSYKIPNRKCPDCGEEDRIPAPSASCTCPTMIYIPPGQHIHVNCPVHGQVKIYGNGPIM